MNRTGLTTAPPLLQLQQISKAYGHVQALQEVDFDVVTGEVIALVGDNGAGKSTLAKVISGAIKPDRGEMYFDGRPYHVDTPLDAKKRGIEIVYQNLGLLDNLTIAANVFLGREVRVKWLGRRNTPLMDLPGMARQTRAMLDQYGLDVDSTERLVSELSGGQRQLIAISRAASWGSRVIVMDEPTAALGVRESRKVLELLLQLKGRGVAVIVISHNLEHVFSVADRIAVLRRGRNVGTVRTTDSSPSEIVHYITGAEFSGSNGRSIN